MVDRGFFFFFLFLEKLPRRMEKGKKNIWIYASFSLLFSFSSFLSFFHFINQSGILFIILEKKKGTPFFQRASKCLTRLSERARFSRVPWFGKHSTSFSIIDSSVFIPMSACIFVHPLVLISVFPVNHRMQIRASRGYYDFRGEARKKIFPRSMRSTRYIIPTAV